MRRLSCPALSRNRSMCRSTRPKATAKAARPASGGRNAAPSFTRFHLRLTRSAASAGNECESSHEPNVGAKQRHGADAGPGQDQRPPALATEVGRQDAVDTQQGEKQTRKDRISVKAKGGQPDESENRTGQRDPSPAKAPQDTVSERDTHGLYDQVPDATNQNRWSEHLEQSGQHIELGWPIVRIEIAVWDIPVEHANCAEEDQALVVPADVAIHGGEQEGKGDTEREAHFPS